VSDHIQSVWKEPEISDLVFDVDPLLANPEGGDFHLLEGSPAIDAGMTSDEASQMLLTLPDTDFEGDARVINGDIVPGAAVDIGADEYNPYDNVRDLIVEPSGPVAVDTTIFLEATITDLQTVDPYTADWDWGDGNTFEGTIEESSGLVTGEYSYAEPGVYTVSLNIQNSNGDLSGKAVYQYVVVYDPAAGFVTGGGWIDSPEGAYTADPTLAGKATFGFVSKYQKGADLPTGNTEFQFKAGDLNFHSTSYEWLLVTGSDYAKFKGSGPISGTGDYKFMVWAGDDEPDTFRIRIWLEAEETGAETDIYDNGFDQAIGGGSIVIHTK
jgi:PKD repeat protein